MTRKGRKSKIGKKSGALKSHAPDEDFPIVGIGASAGGLEALEKFLSHMPSDGQMAFVIVMHFDPSSRSLMAEILKRYTKMEVFQAEEGMKVEPNCVYIIPPNKDMAILGGILHLLEPVVSQGIRHPIDFFFRSLANDKEEKAICIILSGTGTEGTLGLKAVKGENGMVMVQEIKSAAYDGMPRSAIATGLVDYILPPEKMPEHIIKFIKQFNIKNARKPEIISDSTNSLQKIIILIRDQIGHDFSLYKQSTIVRRIERRMNIHQIDNISDYVRYLRENELEIETLYKELLIGVTNFFRDPEAFDVLKKEIVDMFKNITSVRIWVPACSTGEEAYSIAMVCKECMDEMKSDVKVQIFATDVDKTAIEIARTGVYPGSIAVDVPLESLKRFLNKNPDTYIIKKEIREIVIFSHQNVIKDPPFSKVDMVSCRNLLIYLGPELQKKLLRLFHYSLNPDGILFLGNSETIGEATDLFSILDRKWRFFKRRGGGAASREELQSINEELMTLNAEHQAKLEDFSRVINDMNNLLASTEIATIFLDNDLHIKGFTPAATRLINLIKTDIGRPVSDIMSNLEYENLIKDVKIVLNTLVFQEREMQDKNGLSYLMRILPYRTTENIIDGAVITFIDITERKRMELGELDARLYADSIVNTIRESIIILDKDLRVLSANLSFFKTFQVSKEDTENKFIYEIGSHQWDIPELRELLEEIISRNSIFNDFEVEYEFPRIGYRKMMLNARRIFQEGRNKEMILLAIEDITDRAGKG